MNTVSRKNKKTVHFIGIGGIGISAIARMFLLEGKKVSGSDMKESRITGELQKSGATISIGHRESNIPEGCDLVIYTVAASADNPEITEAKRQSITTLSYPEALGEISREKFTIAISGTHGKTTTTGMVAKILKEAGADPTVIIGSILTDEKSNFVSGKGRYFVAEACEYRRSFLNLSPKLIIITNIDNDHLDYYKDTVGIQKAFQEFVEKLPADGVLVCDATHPNISPILSGLSVKVTDYKKFLLKVPALKFSGEHNKQNAAAAFTAAAILGIPEKSILQGLKSFSGTARRFEYKGKTKNGALVYDDYAHHPSEIRATLQGAIELFPNKKIILAFQPHLYSRTKLLFDDFVEALSKADEVFLAPIYAAREAFDASISHKTLAEEINNKKGGKAEAFGDFESMVQKLENISREGIIITMGAGNIYEVGESLANKENKR